MFGSAVEYLAFNTQCPFLIVKDRTFRSERKNGAFRWAVCLDGSEKSYKAFHFMSSLMAKSKDECVALCVSHSGVDPSQVQSTTQSLFLSLNIQGKFIVLNKENSFDKPDKAIVKYLMEQTGDGYVDFVAVGNNGADYSSHQSSKYLGSVANGVIRNSNLNVIFVA